MADDLARVPMVFVGEAHDHPGHHEMERRILDRALADVRIVNVGSVGEAPAGDHASATLITTSQLGIQVEQITVPLPAPGAT